MVYRIFSRKYLCDTVVKLSVEHDFVKGRSGNESRYFSEKTPDNAVTTVNGKSQTWRFADTLEQRRIRDFIRCAQTGSPNLIIYTAKFITSFAVVFYYDVTFALLALIGIPVSIVMSKTLLSKMQAKRKQSAAMNAKMSGFHQETFSNIQAIKAFDLIPLYVCRLQELQKDYFSMKKKFQKLSAMTSIMMSFVGIVVSYSCYALGIYRVFTGAITYGTMTLFLSLSGSLTSTLNALIAMVPTAVSITTSAGRLMDILDMPHEDFSERKQAKSFIRKISGRESVSAWKMYRMHIIPEKVLTDVDFWAEPDSLRDWSGLPAAERRQCFVFYCLYLNHSRER